MVSENKTAEIFILLSVTLKLVYPYKYPFQMHESNELNILEIANKGQKLQPLGLWVFIIFLD